MTSPERRWLRRVGLRVGLARAFNVGLESAALFAGMAALVVLVLRRTLSGMAEHEGAILIALALAASTLAVVRWFRGRVAADDLAALADRQANARGLLLALRERPDPRWRPWLTDTLRDASLPEVRLSERTRFALPATIFLVAALLVPPIDDASADVAPTTSRLAGLAAALEAATREEMISGPDAERMRNELEEIARDVRENGLGARQWEAIDALESRLDGRLGQAAVALARLAAASGAADAALAALGGTDLDDLDGASAALTQAVQALSSDDLGGLAQLAMLGGSAAELLSGLSTSGGELSPETMQRLQELLASLDGELDLRASVLAALDEGDVDLAALRGLLEPDGGAPGPDAETSSRRSRAHVDEAPELRRLFALERVEGRDLLAAAPVVAESYREIAPADEDEELTRGAERAHVDEGRDRVSHHRLLPRHRGAVRRYFERIGEEGR